MPVRTKNVDFFMIYIVTINVAETTCFGVLFSEAVQKGR